MPIYPNNMNSRDISAFERLKASGNLPSPKGVALAIMRLTQKDDASMAELARVIKADPAFVGRLIKAANGVNANPGRPVVSVQEALVVLGMPAVRNLALGFSLLSQYRQGGCKGFDYLRFWAASLACGIALQALTLRTRAAQAEEAFSVGLLARVGELALATLYAEDYAGLLRTASKNPAADLTALEVERFALSHRDLTLAMLKDWGLPRIYYDAAFLHESCDAATQREGSREYLLLQALALARLVAEVCVADEAARAAIASRLFVLGEHLGIGSEELGSLCDGVVREWKDWASILGVTTQAAPAFARLVPAEPRAEPGAEPDKAPAGLRVLVVEEDGATRATLQSVLEGAGYAVFAAANGQEGLRTAVECQPQVLVTGRNLPFLDGFELTRMLRDIRIGKGMYILMLSAPDKEDELVDGFEAGVDDYLPKPLNPRLLLARLHAGERLVRVHREMERDHEEAQRYASELSIANRRLQEAALTDVLTGFPNRRYAMDRIQQEWAASQRSGRALACMVVDLDEFKRVNDRHGHDVGDAYLNQVALALRGAVRAQDAVCRTGGDEFLVICPDTTLEAALAVAERMRCAVDQAGVRAGELVLRASLSIGVAVRDETMPHADALIKRADEGVYLAKQQGRNRVAAPQANAKH